MPFDEVFTDKNGVFICALILNRAHVELVEHFTDAIKRMILDWLVLNAEKSSYDDGSCNAGDSYLRMTCLKLKILAFLVVIISEKFDLFPFMLLTGPRDPSPMYCAR